MNHAASKGGKKNASTKNDQQLRAPHVVRVAGSRSPAQVFFYIADVYLRNNSLSD